ncbi:hypothetical protein Ga0100231_024605 [Opitutaceae bacterium TAV4]|nr:hypothetical protein Ga0100231_024605 [Opitutaceae bacterium TAV4]
MQKKTPTIAHALFVVIFSIFTSIHVGAADGAGDDPLEAGFVQPPPSARPLTWWHWINGHVSKDGIRADLEDMKAAGIAGLQFLDVDGHGLAAGPIRHGSDAWHENVQYAIETATRLGLTFDIMNCAGWSTSGGPWITPEHSMKMLVWSETPVVSENPARNITVTLPQPEAVRGLYRDVAVIAVPSDLESDSESGGTDAAFSCNIIAGLDPTPLAAAGNTKALRLPADAATPSFTWKYADARERRMARLIFGDKQQKGRLAGQIEASDDDGKTFRDVGKFDLQFGHANTRTVEINFSSTKARIFRLTFRRATPDAAPWPLSLASLSLSNEDRIENFRTKSLSTLLWGQFPQKPRVATASSEAALRPEQIINLTQQFSEANGRVEAALPAGRWTLLRFGYTTTGKINHPAQPEGRGLEVDKFDTSAARFHFEKSLGRILDTAAARNGKSVTGVLVDSWEAGLQNWTPAFPDEFRERRGYDLLPWLPALAGRVIGSVTETDAVFRDFRQTASDLVAENYYGTLRKLANAQGLKLYTEPYHGGAFEEFQAGAQADVVMTEFWVSNWDEHSKRVKKMASLVHSLGKNVLAGEAFTTMPEAGRWRQTPGNLKYYGDRAFLEGLNRIVFHTYVHQPRSDLQPGFTLARWGSQFGRLNTWWTLGARAWTDYLARSQWLLQQGHFVGDVLVLKTVGINTLEGPSYSPVFPDGYAWDFIAPAQLKDAKVGGGYVSLANGASYRVVFLPNSWVADVSLLRCLEKLWQAGVPVFGPPPSAPSGRNDITGERAEWDRLLKKLWHEERVHKGGEIDVWLRKNVPPDFTTLPPPPSTRAGVDNANTNAPFPLRYVHRSVSGGDAEIYFVVNSNPYPVSTRATFRESTGRAEIWNPVSGERHAAGVLRNENGHATVELNLDAMESVFVVFRKKQGTSPSSLAPADDTGGADGKTLVLDGPWEVEFRPPIRKAFTRIFQRLEAWNESADSDARYFSGAAVYRAEFLNKGGADGRRAELLLGEVCDIAAVRLNDRDLGVAWTAPWRLSIPAGVLREGANKIEITVANRWVNRLIGDEALPLDARYTTSSDYRADALLLELPAWFNDPAAVARRERQTFSTWRAYTNVNEPLLKSGLLGPVSIRIFADREE